MHFFFQDSTITCFFKYTVSRITHNKDNPGEITEEKSVDLEPNTQTRELLAKMLSNPTDTQAGQVVIPFMLPKFVKVKNQGSLEPSAVLLEPDDDNDEHIFRNLSIMLFHSNEENDNTMWWEVKEDCSSSFFSKLPFNTCINSMVMYMFSDRLFPTTLSFLTANGIIGMYTSFIIIISRFIRGFMSDSSKSIMFDDLPYVDRILQLCLDIYLVREALEFALEEDLFARLIFLYRSPELMIKWTREPDGTEMEDDVDAPSVMERPQNDDPRDNDPMEVREGLRLRRT